MSRNQEITERWNAGQTMAQIARMEKITRERVRQIINRCAKIGMPTLTGSEWKRKKEEKRHQNLERGLISKQWEIPDYTKYRSQLVRERVRRLGYLKKCECCGWNKHIGALHLHHADRNRKNNNLENIFILCPNCHWVIHHLDGDMRGGVGPNNKENQYQKQHQRRKEDK